MLLAFSAAQAKEPLEGTWLLNRAESAFRQTPGPRGQMRTYSIANGVETMDSRGIGADGKTTVVHYDARYDGKDYDIVGSAGGNKIALRRIDALTTESIQKRDGKPAITATRRVSRDGSTLTVETKGTLPDGQVIDATMVFVRK